MREELQQIIQQSAVDGIQVDLSNQKIKDDEFAEILNDVLAKMPAIEDIFLDRNFIGDTSAVLLAQKLEGLSSLKTLSLELNSIGKTGMQALAKLIAQKPDLQVCLHGNAFKNASDWIDMLEQAKKPTKPKMK